MLKKLQKKFVILTTAISVVVLVLIAVTINLANYISVSNRSEEILNLLIENDMSFKGDYRNWGNFSDEIAFTTRYFVVRVDSETSIGLVDTTMISSVTSDQAVEYAQQVYASDKEEGIIANFRYKRVETGYGYTYIFLDIFDELVSHNNYIMMSGIIVAVAVILIFISSCLLSKRAVAPIAQSYEMQKRFITDVSHEFKTPLAIIQADNEVTEIDGGETEWTRSIKNQVKRLNTLVENLISLTKMDEEKAQVVKAPFNLSQTVANTLEQFTPSAKTSHVEIVRLINDNVIYSGEEESIRKLIEILIENAIKYAPEGSDIKALLYLKQNRIILSLENVAENIDIGKHNNWFLRFYREDASRNSETKGFGIGLSVAKAICDKHGAKITAESKTGKEVIISVMF